MDREKAEVVALEILGFIASDEYLMRGLITQSGLSLNDIRESATDPMFLGQIIDYFMTNDQAVQRFIESMGYQDQIVRNARNSLPGTVQRQ